jgi:HEAT repeat protein
VEALGRALKRGSLLTPFRTRQLRRRAAEALAAIGTPEALEVLQAASIGGTSGVRAAANAALSSSPPPPPPAAAERTP